MANRTLGIPILEGIDYSCIFVEPSALEQAYAIYCNVLELDDAGTVLNDGAAQLGVSRSAVYKLASMGKIRLIKIAGRSLITDAEIQRLTSEGT